jgi:hypothetical protein
MALDSFREQQTPLAFTKARGNIKGRKTMSLKLAVTAVSILVAGGAWVYMRTMVVDLRDPDQRRELLSKVKGRLFISGDHQTN